MPNGSLRVLVFGGTMACEDVSDDPDVQDLRPKRGKIDEILNFYVPDEVKKLFKTITVEEAEPFIDSADARCDTLERIVNVLRNQVRSRSERLVVVIGTDTAAHIVQCAADGIDAEKLDGDSIIFTASLEAVPKRKKGSVIDMLSTDAPGNLTNAIYLSSRPEMDGNMGFYFNGHLCAPRGIRKVVANDSKRPFQSRYGPLTVGYNPPVFNWNAFETHVDGERTRRRNVIRPAGTGDRFKLLPGVEAVTLDPESNYENLVGFVEGSLRRRTLNGMIVQVPGSCNIRQHPDDLKSLAEAATIATDAGVPFAVIADPQQRQHVRDRRRTIRAKPSVYGGSVTKLADGYGINASPLGLAEAKVTMAQSLYCATKHKDLKGSPVVDFVREDMQMYLAFVNDEITHEQYVRFRQGRCA